MVAWCPGGPVVRWSGGPATWLQLQPGPQQQARHLQRRPARCQTRVLPSRHLHPIARPQQLAHRAAGDPKLHQRARAPTACGCRSFALAAGCAAEREDRSARHPVSPLPPTLAASRLVRLHGPDPLTRMSWNGVAPRALAICRKTGWERRGNGTVNATPTDRKTVDRLRYSVRNSEKTLVALHRYIAQRYHLWRMRKLSSAN